MKPRHLVPTVFALLSASVCLPELLGEPFFEFQLAVPSVVDAQAGQTVQFSGDARMSQTGVPDATKAVEAWSMGIAVEGDGCSLETCTYAGTASDVAKGGWNHLEIVNGDVILAVVLGLEVPRTLPPAESPHTVLHLDFQGRVPSGAACASCRVRYLDGLVGSGLPIRNVVTAHGDTYRPMLDDRTIQLYPSACGDEPPPVLDDAGPRSFGPITLAACRSEACLRFTAPAERKVLLRLEGATPRDLFRLAASLSGEGIAPPGDLTSSEPSPAPRLVIPRTREGVYTVRIQSLRLGGSTARVTLVADLCDIAVESLTADRAARGYPIPIGISGSGFRGGDTRFFLTPSDGGTSFESVEASDVRVLSSERADVVFDLSGLGEEAEGTYCNLLVRRVVGGETFEHELERALEVKPPAFAHGLEVRLTGHARYGYDRDSRLGLRIVNVSDGALAAPFFRIVGAERTSFRLGEEAEDDPSSSELLVLGTSEFGPAGVLPPGAEREIPIVFKSRERDPPYPLVFHLQLFTPPALERIPWSTLDSPPGATDWEEACLKLSGWLGKDWGELGPRLGDLATRLARRWGDASSVRRIFQYAYAEAIGRPGGAVVGRVLGASEELPIQGLRVAAVDGDGKAAACAETDAEGTFALEGLKEGAEYKVIVEGHRLTSGDSQAVEVPEGDDLLGLELILLERDGTVKLPDCPPSGGEGLPTRPPLLPDEHFTDVATFEALVVSSFDPNDKGDNVPDPFGWNGAQEVIFRITIQNDPRGPDTPPAQRVEIVDTLGDAYVPTSVRPLEFSFGSKRVLFGYPGAESSDACEGLFPPGSKKEKSDPNMGPGASAVEPFTSVSPLCEQPELGLELHVDVHTDTIARTVTWVLQAIDPATCNPPDCVDHGFLPVEDGTGRGQGDVAFAVRLREDLEEGTPQKNQATIRFDQSKEKTAHAPTRHFTLNPAPEEPAHPVPRDEGRLVVGESLSWSASRYASVTYDATLWKEDEESPLKTSRNLKASVWQPACTYAPTDPGVALEYDTTYRWQIVARNLRGRTGDATPDDSRAGPEWTFRTYPEYPGRPTGLRTLEPESPTPTFLWSPGAHNTSFAVYLKPAEDPWPEEPTAVLNHEPGHMPSLSLTKPEAARWAWKVVGRNDRAPEGWAGSHSAVATFPPPEDPPCPSALPPTDLTATAQGKLVNLSWKPPAVGPSPTSYVILRDDEQVGEVTQPSYQDRSVELNKQYCYRVKAKACEQEGFPSREVCVVPVPFFVRGNADALGQVNITDGIFVLNFLFLGGPRPPCLDAADGNDDGALNITDGIYILNFLFLGGTAPPAPHPDCGADPTDDDVDCEAFAPCAN